MYEITTSIDPDKWRDFVKKHPNGNIFQTQEMAEVYRETKRRKPITLAVTDNNGDIQALLQAVIVKEIDGIFGSFSTHSVIQGGPLFVDGEIGKEALITLMKEYNKLIKNEVIFDQIRNMWDTSKINSSIMDLGYKYEEHLNFLIDLNRSEEKIWGDVHKSRRKGINRAENLGVQIEILNRKDLPTFYDIVYNTYKNVKLPLADISFLESAYKFLVPKNMAQFYLARHENKYIGARAVLKFNGLIYDWFAGSLSEYSSMYVNEAMVWHILKEFANKGYHTFDFGGAGNPNEEYGVREFKKRFGGTLVNYGRYIKVCQPTKLWFSKKAFEIYRRVKR